MLVLNRKVNESIIIDDRIEIRILETADGRVKLGISAPKDVQVLRKEVYEEIKNENACAATAALENLRLLSENR